MILSNVQLCHVLGRSLPSLKKLQKRFESFPKPIIKRNGSFALTWDSDAIRSWIIAHADELQPRYVNEIALDIGLFDERLALILAEKKTAS